MNTINFQVDSRLPKLLSQEYRSTERALKELIDNAWDADADNVWVSLPKPMTQEPIIIHDDGNGMTEEEIRRQYLVIATDRRSARGDFTTKKKRRVKGRKGIGKFAGLMAASQMQVTTQCRSVSLSFKITMEQLATVRDVEELKIPLFSEPCKPETHGTKISLTNFHQNLNFPVPDKLRQLLLRDYGREQDFAIFVDGKRLGISDVQGSYKESEQELPQVGFVKLRFAISDQKGKSFEPGITIRVGGKVIGAPDFFGLDKADDFPPKLLQKLYGEVEADGLIEHVTAGWDAIVENSEHFQKLTEFVQPILREAFKEQYGSEMRMAFARLQKKIQERVGNLPEFKRDFAERAIGKVLEKYYGEPESKVEPLVFVLLEALEKSDYRVLLEHIAEAQKADIVSLVDSLNSFSLVEMAFLVEQANARTTFLDQLETLCEDPNCLEVSVHKALGNALWVFGPQYSLFSSNQTLRKQVETYLETKYGGSIGSKRPDLLLNEDLDGRRLLIEFKRPSHGLAYADYQQAITYRHEFSKHSDLPIDIMVIGGHRTSDLPSELNKEPNVRIIVFSQLISSARNQLNWLLKQLLNDGGGVSI